MADVPLPGEELTTDRPVASIDVAAAVPAPVLAILQTLWDAGFAAYVVGGSVRDVLMGRAATDWDLATSARPAETESLFPETLYENAFGTVAVGTDDPAIGEVEITTFRSDHDYADFRRPHRVEFSDSIELDLARRDVTVNAIAWGAEAGGLPDGRLPHLVDPYGGRADIAAGILRTVGDPRARFEEDALRMLRVVRFAATLGFGVEAATLAGIQARADRVRFLSGRAHRDGARQDPRGARAVRRAAAAGRYRPAGAHLVRARRAARDPPEQAPRRGPVGPHDAGGRWRGARADLHPAGGAPPRHRQARDDGRRPVPGPRRRRRRAGRRPARATALATPRARAGRPHHPQPHVRLRPDLV